MKVRRLKTHFTLINIRLNYIFSFLILLKVIISSCIYNLNNIILHIFLILTLAFSISLLFRKTIELTKWISI